MTAQVISDSATPPAYRERLRVVAASAILLFLIGLAALWHEIGGHNDRFRAHAQTMTAAVSQRLAEGMTLLSALHGFFQSGSEIAADRFPLLAEQFRLSHSQVSWLGYARRVDPNQLSAYEEHMEREGFINFKVKQYDTDGVPATFPYLLPLSILEPLEPRWARVLGNDVLNHPQWHDVIERAIVTGRTAAARVDGISDGESGVILLRATYRGSIEPVTSDGRLHQLSGIILVFLDGAQLLAPVNDSPFGMQSKFAVNHDADFNVVAIDFSSEDDPQRIAPSVSTVFPIDVAGLERNLVVSAPLKPRLAAVLAAMTVALAPVLTIVLAVRSRRTAQATERRAFARARVAEATLRSIDDAVIRVESDGTVHYLNAMARKLTGHLGQPEQPVKLAEIMPLWDRQDSLVSWEQLQSLLKERQPVIFKDHDGRSRVLSGTLASVVGDQHLREGYVLGLRDVTREHELAQELQHQASHDPLTELPNRRAFEMKLHEMVEWARNDARVHTMLYVDLDQFKLVNDTCGHSAGDQMLRQLAGVLAAECRTRDMLARLGGDEFGVLLSDCPVEKAASIAQRICDTVTDFRFIWEERAFDLGASIGVVEISRSSGTAADVQRSADMACYAAKDMGGNRFHIYRPEDQIIARNASDMLWQSELKRAIEERRLLLHTQPIVALNDNCSPPGLSEVLLRMRGRDGELIPPRAFITAAERYGLMRQLDREVIRLAFEHLGRTADNGIMTSINLSGQTITDPELEGYLLGTSSEYAVEPTRICFEITETSAISNLNLAVRVMNRLRKRGFSFALDDFGAGLSSLSYLKQLPIDFLKIDGQFIRELDSDAVARSMVSSIVNVAAVLGIQCIAEMVEDARTASRLEELGVDYAQGYHFGRPTSLVNVLAEVKSA